MAIRTIIQRTINPKIQITIQKITIITIVGMVRIIEINALLIVRLILMVQMITYLVILNLIKLMIYLVLKIFRLFQIYHITVTNKIGSLMFQNDIIKFIIQYVFIHKLTYVIRLRQITLMKQKSLNQHTKDGG